MKKVFLSLACLIHMGFAQDSLHTNTTNFTEKSTAVAALEPFERLTPDDFKKFYIGFSSKANSLELITLDINKIDTADSLITFHYTLNTRYKREEGIGELWPDKSRIKFQNMEEGLVSLPQDGKIEFESVALDSINYWKLKEK